MDLILKSEGLEILSEEALMTVEGGIGWDEVYGAVVKFGKGVVDTFYYAGYKLGYAIGR
ncbi:MAG: hypothetical protein KM296_00380 [Brockia lithotrophica]|nr:hypothetical protein [Brockia lithotrophica]